MAPEVGVRVEVDGAGITTAAARLAAQADQLRSRLVACTRLTDGLTDASLRAGATTLSDCVSDALELVAMDLELLAGKVRAGTRLYDGVERGIRDTLGGAGG